MISPISMGPDGAYNVNADLCAAAVAIAVSAQQLVFLTNKPGVMIRDTPVMTMKPIHANTFIAEGLIHSGMIPKVNAGIVALDGGVRDVIIANLDSWILGGGTKIIHESKEG